MQSSSFPYRKMGRSAITDLKVLGVLFKKRFLINELGQKTTKQSPSFA